MKSLLALAIACGLLLSCGNDAPPAAARLQEKFSDSTTAKYDNILEGLKNNYVLNFRLVDPAFRNDLLEAYGKTEGQLYADSVRYFEAVDSFFSCDAGILHYLTVFNGDDQPCRWVYTPYVFSSTLRPWQVRFNNELGALVLIRDYLCYDGQSTQKRITTDPAVIEDIITLYSMPGMMQWLQNNAGTKEELRAFFKRHFQ